MPQILPLEMVALLLGMVSAGAADCAYHRGRIPRQLHLLWLSLTIPAMCLPVVNWVAAIFVGPGAAAYALAAALEAALFLWLYANLRKLPAARRLGHGQPLPSPAQPPAPPRR